MNIDSVALEEILQGFFILHKHAWWANRRGRIWHDRYDPNRPTESEALRALDMESEYIRGRRGSDIRVNP